MSIFCCVELSFYPDESLVPASEKHLPSNFTEGIVQVMSVTRFHPDILPELRFIRPANLVL